MNSNSDQNKTPFNKLLNDNWDYVFNYILKKTSNDYIAEEITIQTFSKAFQKIKLYDKKFSFKTWLISIAKNTYADQLRKKKTIINNYENVESVTFFIYLFYQLYDVYIRPRKLFLSPYKVLVV